MIERDPITAEIEVRGGVGEDAVSKDRIVGSGSYGNTRARVEGNDVARAWSRPTDRVVGSGDVHARTRIGARQPIVTGFAPAVGECTATICRHTDAVGGD